MEFLNNIAAQFFAIPAIAEIVNSHAILRVATKQYGGPLLGLIVLFIVLLLVLIVGRMGKKPKKPKPVREKKAKPQKAPRQKKAKPAKVKGPNKAIMAKLAKLPQSKLPLYPVADKRKSLEDALLASAAIAPQPVVDEASLIASLDDAPEPIEMAAPAPNPEVEVASFSIDETTASSLMEEPVQADDDFDMPVAPSLEPTLTATEDDDHHLDLPEGDDEFDDEHDEDDHDDDDFDLPPLSASSEDDRGEGQTIDPVPSLDFDPIEPVPAEEKSADDDDGEAIDIPVGSFGSDDGTLSGAAQEKLAELNDRGVT